MNKFLEVIWSPEALLQKEFIENTKPQNQCVLYFSKLISLIEDIKRNPFRGLGKPEPLKYKVPPCWSRRINKKDRLIYRIHKRDIYIISILGHYND